MNVRRVATGHDEDGKSVIASDVMVEPIALQIAPGAVFHPLWGGAEAPTFRNAGAPPDGTRFFPSAGGFGFGFVTILPESTVVTPEALDLDEAVAEANERLPGFFERVVHGEGGLHASATLDLGVVVAGQVSLEVDDGESVVLNVGDTYVQSGTRHRWRNVGEVPAVPAAVAVGAHHRDID